MFIGLRVDAVIIINMFVDMGAEMCMDMFVGVCMGPLQLCANGCRDKKCVGMCRHVCSMYTDICIDMCTDMCKMCVWTCALTCA